MSIVKAPDINEDIEGNKDGIGATLERDITLIKDNYILLVPNLLVSVFITLIVLSGLYYFFGTFFLDTWTEDTIPDETFENLDWVTFIVWIFVTIILYSFLDLFSKSATLAMANEALLKGKTSLKTGINTIRTKFIGIIILHIYRLYLIIILPMFFHIISLILLTTIAFIFYIYTKSWEVLALIFVTEIIFGYLLFFILFFLMRFMLILSLPSLVIDNINPWNSIKHSYKIMRTNIGRGIKLIFMILIVYIVISIIGFILSLIPFMEIIVSIFQGALLSAITIVLITDFYQKVTAPETLERVIEKSTEQKDLKNRIISIEGIVIISIIILFIISGAVILGGFLVFNQYNDIRSTFPEPDSYEEELVVNKIAINELIISFPLPETSSTIKGNAYSTLGSSYRDLATFRDWDPNMNKAIEAYETALTYYTPDAHPEEYSRIYRSLGATYIVLADGVESNNENNFASGTYFSQVLNKFGGSAEKEAYLDMSLGYYLDAMEVPAISDDLRGSLYYDLGNNYFRLGLITDSVTNYGKSIDAFEKSLNKYTIYSYPEEYAYIQYKLGDMHLFLSNENNGDRGHLVKSTTALNNAMRIYIRDYPDRYIQANYLLGKAYVELAEFEEPEVNYENSIKAFLLVLPTYNITYYPVEYAIIQYALGNAYSGLSTDRDMESNLEKAIIAYLNALEVDGSLVSKYLPAKADFGLGYAYFELASIKDEELNLNKAIYHLDRSVSVGKTDKNLAGFNLIKNAKERLEGITFSNDYLAKLEKLDETNGNLRTSGIKVAKSVKRFGIYELQSFFDYGETVYIYIEADRISHDGNIDLLFFGEIFDPSDQLLAYWEYPVTERSHAFDQAHWHWMNITQNMVIGEYSLRMRTYDFISGDSKTDEGHFYIGMMN